MKCIYALSALFAATALAAPLALLNNVATDAARNTANDLLKAVALNDGSATSTVTDNIKTKKSKRDNDTVNAKNAASKALQDGILRDGVNVDAGHAAENLKAVDGDVKVVDGDAVTDVANDLFVEVLGGDGV